ncbi:hypothetical protein [uncultured Methanobrevibacter sp.]|uniref:hypothetical protein n=1 Tax=uncultured Methanobrevibacter sp. TaxID=253161 RepID=UPI0025F4D6E6|nr:hypothetical protein [uncultured Methanobrevibacter sp.]
MKDTNNLLEYNEWSAGEYNNTIPVTPYNIIGICTNTYSSIGEQSIKLTRNGPGANARISYNYSIINKTIVASAHIRTESTNAQLLLIELNSSGTIQQNVVTIPSNTQGTFSVSLISGSNNSKFIIQFSNTGDIGSVIFIDNIILTVS